MADDWHIAHRSDGRTRLKFHPRPQEPERLTRFAEAVAALEGVERATPRPLTGSLILEHPACPWEEIAPRLQHLGLNPGPKPPPPAPAGAPLASLAALVGEVDRAIREGTEGRTDLRALLFLLLMALAVVQLFRGQVAGPAMGLFWYAYSLLRQEAAGEPSPPAPDE